MITFHPLPITRAEELFRFEVVFFEDRIVEIVKLRLRYYRSYRKGTWLIRCLESNESDVKDILVGRVNRHPGQFRPGWRVSERCIFARNDADAVKQFVSGHNGVPRCRHEDIAAIMLYLTSNGYLNI